jgi:polyhydroxybutyrate depolymerase
MDRCRLAEHCNLPAARELHVCMISKFILCLCCLVMVTPVTAQTEGTAKALPKLQRVELKVEEVAREALVYAPAAAKEKPVPVVFVFHGHGGGMLNAARSFAMHTHWPEAIAVYPQGLPTVGQLTDPEGKRAGWQPRAGVNGDRDLKFFDALLTKLKQDYKVDDRRLYATGHSNGGGFTYLLWAERGDKFAAFAPSAAVMRQVDRLKPKPAMHLAGEQDALVKYRWQELMMRTVRKVNGCDVTGEAWGERATRYASKGGTPVVTYIHLGGHEFSREAVPLMVKFLKEQILREAEKR